MSLFDTTRLFVADLFCHRQVTDSYLLALAVAHAGKLVTLDKRLSAHAVVGGVAGLEVMQTRRRFSKVQEAVLF